MSIAMSCICALHKYFSFRFPLSSFSHSRLPKLFMEIERRERERLIVREMKSIKLWIPWIIRFFSGSLISNFYPYFWYATFWNLNPIIKWEFHWYHATYNVVNVDIMRHATNKIKINVDSILKKNYLFLV